MRTSHLIFPCLVFVVLSVAGKFYFDSLLDAKKDKPAVTSTATTTPVTNDNNDDLPKIENPLKKLTKALENKH
jgi:hypothetical protein